MQVNKETYLNGEVILIDKDYKWTSFDVVKKIRNILGIKKIGHAGTLDPLATGLLIICTGKMTKEIHRYQAMPKEYTGSIYLGATRPSFDKETPINETFDTSNLTEIKIRTVADTFSGEIEQVPPTYSAVRKEGKRVYELARAGKKIKLEPRKVNIIKFEISRIAVPFVEFSLICSKGFYVRSLASDFGKALNCGGYLENLRRTAIGDYRVEKAFRIHEFEHSLTA